MGRPIVEDTTIAVLSRRAGYCYTAPAPTGPASSERSPDRLPHVTASSVSSASTMIVAEGGISPAIKARAILVSTSCWMKRLSGRAPYTGS